jgi:ketosteroid isomerase-like protein
MAALARRLFDAATSGDAAMLRQMFAPDAIIWNNVEDVEHGAADGLAMLGRLGRRVAQYRYERVRLQATETGFVEQHIVRGTSSDGKDFAIPKCVLVTVAGGLITRLEEYVDAKQLAPLLSGARRPDD